MVPQQREHFRTSAEDPLQQRGPIEAIRRRHRRRLRRRCRRRRGRGRRRQRRPGVWFSAITGQRWRRWPGDDLVAQAARRREDTMPYIAASPGGDAAGEIRVRRRNQGHELVEQLDAGHHQLPAAVGERAFHVVCEAPSTGSGVADAASRDSRRQSISRRRSSSSLKNLCSFSIPRRRDRPRRPFAQRPRFHSPAGSNSSPPTSLSPSPSPRSPTPPRHR